MLKEYGYVRVGAAVNKIKISDVKYNVLQIEAVIEDALAKGVEILVFPELSLTGYTCQELFTNDCLLAQSLQGLKELKKFSLEKPITFIVGAPLVIEDALYNCAISFSNGKIIGITPKTYIPNYREFYEGRYFTSGNALNCQSIILFEEEVPVSNHLIYRCSNYDFVSYAIEICEDMWQPMSPSNQAVVNGAKLIFNLSASNELVGKHKFRKDLVKNAASKLICGYIYASAGVLESTTDLVFSGDLLIASADGKVMENERFSFESQLIYTDMDLFKLQHDRLRNCCFKFEKGLDDYQKTEFKLFVNKNLLALKYSKKPFYTEDEEDLEEILKIQTIGLARRIKALNNCKMVIGISGGADSTLAFLVCLRVCDVLNLDRSSIIAITMPGFGTTDRTYENAKNLVLNSKATLKEISIKEACLNHLRSIGHNCEDHDVTYENAQARERTQILFDYANMVGGIVVGTGDLSEIALGFATYNGDHMSNYGVNCSVPKTLVKKLIEYTYFKTSDECLKKTLKDILDTPISPELLPPDLAGNIVQKSEEIVGSYELNDFFLYHFLRYGCGPKKLYFLACSTFDLEPLLIKKSLAVFIKRFFTQQFKRNCMPDGVKVGSVSLSPRGDWKMSSECSYSWCLRELEEI